MPWGHRAKWLKSINCPYCKKTDSNWEYRIASEIASSLANNYSKPHHTIECLCGKNFRVFVENVTLYATASK